MGRRGQPCVGCSLYKQESLSSESERVKQKLDGSPRVRSEYMREMPVLEPRRKHRIELLRNSISALYRPILVFLTCVDKR